MTAITFLAYCTTAAAAGGLTIVLFMRGEMKRLERQLSAERRGRWDAEDALSRAIMAKTVRDVAADIARRDSTNV